MSPLIPLLFASSLTVMAGAIITPALPLMAEHYKDIGGSEVLIRLVLTMPALFITIISPLAGGLIDKYGRRKFFIFGLTLYAISGSAGLYVNSLELLLISRGFLGIAVSFVMTCVTTMISDLYQGEERLIVMGKQAASMAYGGVIFLLFGGIFASYSWRFPFLMYFISLIVVLLVLKSLPETLDVHSADYHLKTKTKLNFIHFKVGFVIYIGMIFFYLLPTTYPFLIKEKFSIGPGYVGATIACGSMVGGLVSFNYRKIIKKFGYLKVTNLIFASLGTSYILMGAAKFYWVCVVAAMIGGVGAGLMLPHFSSIMARYTNDTNRGKAFGLLTSSLFFGQFSSPLVSLPINIYFSYPQTFIIFGIASILVGILFSLLKWKDS